MAESKALDDWLDKLANRTIAIIDQGQRLAIVINAITGLFPVDAAQALRMIYKRGIFMRDDGSKLVVETVMRGLALDRWPEAHRLLTYRAATDAEDHLTAWLIGSDNPSVLVDDDVSFQVPSYPGGRPLTLGERRSLATRPDRRLLAIALRDPHPMVTARLLANPRITESDVIFMAARRPAPQAALYEIGRHPRWRLSKRVALALVLNPYTPPKISLTLLHTLTLDEIGEAANDDRLPMRLREAARAIYSQWRGDSQPAVAT